MESRAGVIYVIKQLELALRPRLSDVCLAEGMTAAQYTALTVLERRPGITSSELARRSFVRAQTMAATLDPLLESGLVRREPSAGNARRMSLFLTDAGVAAIARVSPAVSGLEDLLMADLGPEERAQFGDLLARAQHAMADAGRPSAAPTADAD